MYDILPFPNITATEPEEQITQVNNYLLQLKEDLEFILTNIGSENLSQELKNLIASGTKNADSFTTEQLILLQQMAGKGLTISDVVNSKEFARFSDGLKEYSDQNEKDANEYTDEKIEETNLVVSGLQDELDGKADADHTHDDLQNGLNALNGTTFLGGFGSKTVADLQSALDTWLDSVHGTSNASAIFSAGNDWVTAWNSGNTTATISSGGRWSVTLVAQYKTSGYTQLRISTYADKAVFYVRKSASSWGMVFKTAFQDEVEAVQSNLTSHDENTTKHITEEERTAWNDKAEASEAVVNSESAHTIDVPSDVAKYAKVNKIGGMAYKVNVGTEEEPIYELRFAPVTEVESVGENLWEYGDVSGTTNVDKSVFYPAGSYVFSCVTTSDDTEATTCQITFHMADGSTVSEQFSKGVRVDYPLTVSSDIVKVSFLASAQESTAKNNNVTCTDIMIIKGAEAKPYAPHTKHTISIPEEVQALEGYGLGIDNTYNNRVEWKIDGSRTYTAWVKHIVLDGVTAGLKMDVTDANTSNLTGATPYAYMQRTTRPVLGQSPVLWCGDIVKVGTNNVLSISVNRSDLDLEDGYTRDQLVVAINKYLNDLYVAGKPVEIVYVPAAPTVTDISDYLTADNIIPIETGGTLLLSNEHGYAVPNEVVCYSNNNEIIAATKFVGDLKGVAYKAKRAVCDGEGNDIAKTFAEVGEQLKNKASKDELGVLTDRVATLEQSGGGGTDLGVVDFKANVTFGTGITVTDDYCHFKKFGKMVVINLRFKTPSSVTTDKVVATLPTDCSIGSANSAGFVFGKPWYVDKTAVLKVTGNTITLAGNNWTASTELVGTITYFTE